MNDHTGDNAESSLLQVITHSGFVTILGQPNVGKSTLMNALLGQDMAIVTRKPQTTRHTLLGVLTDYPVQIVFVDTPGLHRGYKKQLNRYMNKVAKATLLDVDIVLFVISALRWSDEDVAVLDIIIAQKSKTTQVVLVINKVDLIKDKDAILPFINARMQEFSYNHVLPISAHKKQSISELITVVKASLPPGPQYFPAEQTTNRDERFFLTELLRKQLIMQLGQELPYMTAVSIENLDKTEACYKIHAIIWVAKDSQKAMIIGKGGHSLKRIATSARLEMEKYYNNKVFLKTWVKVKSNWVDDAKSMHQLGFNDTD